MEVKSIQLADFDYKAEKGLIKGYFSVFNNVDSDGDRIVKGAFAKTINENKERIAHLFMHNMNCPIGKIQTLKEDDKGLYFESKLSNSSMGRDVQAFYQEGIIKEHSIGFRTLQDEMDGDVRVIKEIQLWEGSSVVLGANPLAQVVKAMAFMEENGSHDGLFETIKAQLNDMTESLQRIEAEKSLQREADELDLISLYNKFGTNKN